MNIPELARHRAHCAALCEALGEDRLSRDPVERAAQHEAYGRARQAYVLAEEAYSRAVATLSPAELDLILAQGRAAA